MGWVSASDDLKAFLAEKMKPYNCTMKKMFGSECYFINNNMFIGVHQACIFMRVSTEDREEALNSDDEVMLFEPMKGRAMKEYIMLPEQIFADSIEFKKYLSKSLKYVESLPPKIPKKRKS